MSQQVGGLVKEQGITRRTFLKGSIGVGIVLLVAEGAGTLSAIGCAKPATGDLTVASTTDFNHAHNVTIPGADIDKPPSEKTYVSDGATHTHSITLAKANLEAIKKGQLVSVVSTAVGTTPHTHTWNIQKA